MVLGSIAGSGNVPGRRDRDSAEQKIRRQGTGKDSIPAADGSNTGSNRNGMDADLPADNWYCKQMCIRDRLVRRGMWQESHCVEKVR